MQQLTLKDIDTFITFLKNQGIKDLENYPVYVGDDDELNGIHSGWYVEELKKDNEDDMYVIDMINERFGNNEFTGKGILIS